MSAKLNLLLLLVLISRAKVSAMLKTCSYEHLKYSCMKKLFFLLSREQTFTSFILRYYSLTACYLIFKKHLLVKY